MCKAFPRRVDCVFVHGAVFARMAQPIMFCAGNICPYRMSRQAALHARTEKCVAKSEKIKEGLEQKKEAFCDLSNKQAETLNERLVCSTPHQNLRLPLFLYNHLYSFSRSLSPHVSICRELYPHVMVHCRRRQTQSELKRTRSRWRRSGR